MKSSKRNKKILKFIRVIVICVLSLSMVMFCAIFIAHSFVFSRADYDQYDTEHYLLYEDIDVEKYPREQIFVQSQENTISAFYYPTTESKGLIVVAPGHRDSNDIKLYEICYFVDAGYSVICVDYTGYYSSGGDSMRGYSQCVYDLDALLDYIEANEKFQNMSIYLFGHSMGSLCARVYASSFGAELSGLILCGTAQVPAGLDFAINTLDQLVEKFGPRTVNHTVAGLLNKFSSIQIKDRASDLDWLSVNRENVKAYAEDELCGFELSLAGVRDLAAIGTAETVHVGARGENITIIFINNTNYGMTGGQMAPTTLIGQKTTTTRYGRDPETTGYPMKMCELISTLEAPAFVARYALNTPKGCRDAKKAIRKAFDIQMAGKGFTFIELLGNCPTNWGLSPLQTLDYMESNTIPYFVPGVYKDKYKDEVK